MDITLLLVGGILSALMVAAFVFSRRSVFASVATFLFSLGFAAFCLFGFFACFEPSKSPVWPWQLAYAVLGTGFFVAALRGLQNTWTHIRQVVSSR